MNNLLRKSLYNWCYAQKYSITIGYIPQFASFFLQEIVVYLQAVKEVRTRWTVSRIGSRTATGATVIWPSRRWTAGWLSSLTRASKRETSACSKREFAGRRCGAAPCSNITSPASGPTGPQKHIPQQVFHFKFWTQCTGPGGRVVRRAFLDIELNISCIR